MNHTDSEGFDQTAHSRWSHMTEDHSSMGRVEQVFIGNEYMGHTLLSFQTELPS